MERLTIPWAEDEIIQITIRGNLKLKGWEKSEIQAQADNKNLMELNQENGRCLVKSTANCTVFVPEAATLEIEEVGGNGNFQDLSGNLQVRKVGGNLNLTNFGLVEIDKIYGNLNAVAGKSDLTLQAVYGNTKIRALTGKLTARDDLKGNLVIEGAGASAATALGNATVNLNPTPGSEHRIKASGNIHCKFPEDASVQITVESTSCTIRVDSQAGTQSIQQPSYEYEQGDGEARIELSAKGFVRLSSAPAGQPIFAAMGAGLEPDLEITDDISSLIDEQMEALEMELNQKLSNMPEAVDPDELSADIDEIVEQARQYSTRAAIEAQARSEAASRRAQEKLARKLELAKRKAERQAKKAAWKETSTRRRSFGTPAPPKTDPVSDDERMIILKMLEEQKISLEEAEALFDALEGQGD